MYYVRYINILLSVGASSNNFAVVISAQTDAQYYSSSIFVALPDRWKTHFSFADPARPIRKITSHLPACPACWKTHSFFANPARPAEKHICHTLYIICQPDPTRRKNHFSLASPARSVGKIISHLPTWSAGWAGYGTRARPGPVAFL